MERHMLNAYAEQVDGLALPAPLGGHPALDFCNTYAGWDTTEGGEYLRSFDHLVVWTAANGLIAEDAAARLRRRARREPRDAAAALDRAREFRTALHAVLTHPTPGRHWDRVADEAAAAMGSLRLELVDGRGAWRPADRTGLALPRLAVARSAAALLTSGDAGFVRSCPGRGCGWLFLDRAGRRRWCTMATCGNRAKARRFAERHGSVRVPAGRAR